MRTVICWSTAFGLLGALLIAELSDFGWNTASAQVLCEIHLHNAVNCKKKRPGPPFKPPKDKIVCVDKYSDKDKKTNKKICQSSIVKALGLVADGGTVIVMPGQRFKENLLVTRPVVLCGGDTSWLARKSDVKALTCNKPFSACAELPDSQKDECMNSIQNSHRGLDPVSKSYRGNGSFPVNMFILEPKDPHKPCIDINPKSEAAEVVISGVHVRASRNYRAGECVWQKNGSLKLQWSDLLGENTAVGMLALTGKSAHIEGNFIEGGQNGIKIFPPYPGTFVLLNNDISHATTGIRVQGGSNVFGIGNRVHENSGDGIVGLEGDAFFARNEVIHNEGSGMRFDRDRLTHSLPRTDAEVIANTMDWNGRGELRAEDASVVGSASNCIVVENKREYRKHVKASKKQRNMREYSNKTDEPGNPPTKVPLGHSKKKNDTGSLYTPADNLYWLETWGMFPTGIETCEKVRGKTWKRRCVKYVQLCRPRQ